MRCLFRSSHQRCSIKKAVLKNLEIFTGKHLPLSLLLIKLKAFRPATLLKTDSNTGIFLWILQKILVHLLWRTSGKGYFCNTTLRRSRIYFYLSTIITKCFMLDVWQGSEYASDINSAIKDRGSSGSSFIILILAWSFRRIQSFRERKIWVNKTRGAEMGHVIRKLIKWGRIRKTFGDNWSLPQRKPWLCRNYQVDVQLHYHWSRQPYLNFVKSYLKVH